MSTAEKRVHRIHQHGKGSPSSNSACLAQRQDSFHPAVAFLVDKPEASFTPKHSESQHPFNVVIRGCYTLLLQEQPQVFQLSPQLAGEFQRRPVAPQTWKSAG